MDTRQLKQFHDALLSAFPTRAGLARMVRFGLGENLAVIAPDTGDLADTVFAMLAWAEAQGKLEALLAAACAANPANPMLHAFAASLEPRPQIAPPASTALTAPALVTTATPPDPTWRAAILAQLNRLEEGRLHDLSFLRLGVDYAGLGPVRAARTRSLIARVEAAGQREELSAAVADALAQQARARALLPRIATNPNLVSVTDLWQALDLGEQPPADSPEGATLQALLARAEETGQFAALEAAVAEATGLVHLTLRGHTDGVWSAAFSPDRRAIVTASHDKTAIVWDAATGQARLTLRAHSEAVRSAAFSLDGRAIVTTSWDGTARVWDPTTGQVRVILHGHTGYMYSAVFSPDGQTIVTASEDKTARVWDAGTGQLRTILRGHSGYVYSAAFSPNGRAIVTASADWTAIIWGAAGGVRLTLRGHTGPVNSAAFSPDGQAIVTTSWDKTAQVWDAAMAQALLTLRDHTLTVLSAAWSSDKLVIVTTSYDRTGIIWEAATGQVLATLRGHTGEVWSAAFSPDGRAIVTASADGTAIVWDALALPGS